MQHFIRFTIPEILPSFTPGKFLMTMNMNECTHQAKIQRHHSLVVEWLMDETLNFLAFGRVLSMKLSAYQ